MNIPFPNKMCERSIVNAMGFLLRPSGVLKGALTLLAVVAAAFSVFAETTNVTSATNAPTTASAAPVATETTARPTDTAPPRTTGTQGFDESAFRIVAERNIFNANRSGGQVRLSSSRRPTRVDSFTLVGTMAYEKGAFAFFNGSSSEFSKVLRTGGVIAGHKIVDVLAGGVKLEADGKILDLPVGSAMRREDEGTWHLSETAASNTGTTYASNREDDHSGRSGYFSHRGFNSGTAASPGSSPGASASSNNGQAEPLASYQQDQKEFKNEEKQERKELKKELKMDAKAESEILKRLMERREKESQ